jgi:hypothetical protein
MLNNPDKPSVLDKAYLLWWHFKHRWLPYRTCEWNPERYPDTHVGPAKWRWRLFDRRRRRNRHAATTGDNMSAVLAIVKSCLRCGQETEPYGNRFLCLQCGFTFHRDSESETDELVRREVNSLKGKR